MWIRGFYQTFRICKNESGKTIERKEKNIHKKEKIFPFSFEYSTILFFSSLDTILFLAYIHDTLRLFL